MKSTLWQPALPFTFKGGLLRSQVQASSTPHPSCSRSSAIDRLGCRRECRRVELRSSKLRRRHTRDYAYCLSPFMRPEPTIGRRLRKAQGRSRWRINSACMQERINLPESLRHWQRLLIAENSEPAACCRQRTHQLPSPSPHINALCHGKYQHSEWLAAWPDYA